MIDSLSREALFTLVDVALEKLPNLNCKGILKPGADPEDYGVGLKHEESLRLCVTWLARIRPVSTPTASSYMCKHIVERLYGEDQIHIWNGVFIAAAVGLGFQYKYSAPNPDFCFSMRDVRRNDMRYHSRMWQELERKRRAIALLEEQISDERKTDELILSRNIARIVDQHTAKRGGVQ